MIIEALIVAGGIYAYAKGYRVRRTGDDIITGNKAPLVISHART
jgi:hypothetical protein